MAGGKSAEIRLTIEKGPFKDGIKDAEKEVKGFGQRSREALKGAFQDGVKGAGAAVSGLVSSIKSAVTMFSGIGGALGTVELIRAATVTDTMYRGIAASIRLGTGNAADYRAMMTAGSEAAQRWGKNVDEIGAAMKKVRDETGDVDFAKKSADVIAQTSRASHESIDALGSLSAQLGKNFGITSDQLQGTLAQVLSLANKGGVGFGELSGAVARFGVIAKQSGMQGEKGLSQFLGLLSAGESGAKGMGRNIGGAMSLIDQLGQASPARSMLLMRAGLTGEDGTLDPWSAQLKNKNPVDLIRAMVVQMGGRKERMALTFQGDQLAFLSDLGAVYKKKFDETTGSMIAKRKAGEAALDEAIQKAAQSAVSASDIQQMATDEMKEGPAKMAAAMEKMKAAFQRPEIADAVSKLADALPKLAEAVSKVVSFSMEHPVAAGAALVGGTAAKGFAGAALTSAMSAGGSLAGEAIKRAMGIGGQAAGSAVSSAVSGAATGVAGEVSKAAGSGLLANAGQFGLAAAAAIGTGMALAAAKNTYDENDKKSHGRGGAYSWLNIKHKLGITSDEDYWKQRGEMTGEDVSGDVTLAAREASLRKAEKFNNSEAGRSLDAYDEAMRRKETLAAWDESVENKDLEAGVPDMLRRPMAPPPMLARPPETQQRSPDDARLLAEMMASRELKVRVVNPEQIRDTGSPGNPRPGYIPRD